MRSTVPMSSRMNSWKRTSVERSGGSTSRSRTHARSIRSIRADQYAPTRFGSGWAMLIRDPYATIVVSDAVTDTGSRCVTTKVASGNTSTSTGNCSRCCGDLSTHRVAAAEPLAALQNLLHVAVRRRLVVGAVVLGPGRHERGGLHQHRAEVDGEDLDLLVHVVNRHLVHAHEVRHRRVHERDAHLRAGERGSGSPGAGCSASASTGSRLSQ